MTEDISLQELLRVGAHFGHRKAKRHPRMKPFLFAQREGINIIDLRATADGLGKALRVTEALAKEGKTILFVGTKRQARDAVKSAAKMAGLPYVTERWIGGLLTNFETIQTRIKKLLDLRNLFETKEIMQYPKKERLVMQDDMRRLERNLGGVTELKKLPDAIFVIDIKHDKLALKEAKTLRIPVIALTDTNVDPTSVQVAIPSNDDAVKVIEYMATRVAEVYKNAYVAPAGKIEAQKKARSEKKPGEKSAPGTITKRAK